MFTKYKRALNSLISHSKQVQPIKYIYLIQKQKVVGCPVFK